MGEFSIARWCAWAPGVTGLSGWQAWLAGNRVENSEQQADVSFLPPLMRRRLDPFARMALHVAWHCAAGYSNLPLVFASRHGSQARTLELLYTLARDETLSPTAFSLSVHNSLPGLFSIARGDRSQSTALAAGSRTLAAALLEGVGVVAEGAPAALVVYADEWLPMEYRAYLDPEEPAFALGLLLTTDGAQPRCRLVQGAGTDPGRSPQVTLLNFLAQNAAVASLEGGKFGWQLQRVGGHA